MQKKKGVVLTQDELLQKQIQEHQQAQELIFKQDCRKTAINMAERFSKTMNGDKEYDAIKIISNAEVIYQWMINITNEELSNQLMTFQQTGNLTFKTP